MTENDLRTGLVGGVETVLCGGCSQTRDFCNKEILFESWRSGGVGSADPLLLFPLRVAKEFPC